MSNTRRGGNTQMADRLPVKTLRVSEPIWSLFVQIANEDNLSRADLLLKSLAYYREARLRELNLQLAHAEQDDDG